MGADRENLGKEEWCHTQEQRPCKEKEVWGENNELGWGAD